MCENRPIRAYAADFETQVRFWRSALDVPEEMQGPNWAEFRVGDARVAIHRVRDEPRDTDAFHLTIVVDDLESALGRVSSLRVSSSCVSWQT